MFPRPGDFFVPPTGPGTYSLLDEVHGVASNAPPRSAYPAFAIVAPPSFDADFRYLHATPAEKRRWFERLKCVRARRLLWSTGRNAWYRLHDEDNRRLTTVDQTYSVPSVRAFLDLAYRDSHAGLR